MTNMSMSSVERLTRALAVRLSRQQFLKGLGALIAGLGLAMVGKVETARADACCPGPECSGCLAGGSICPSGYTRIDHFKCCFFGCQWGCNKCKKNSDGSICYCSHDDLVACPQQICGLHP